MAISIISFEVKQLPVNVRFNMMEIWKQNPFQIGRSHINWELEDDYQLTMMLSRQVSNDYLNAKVLEMICGEQEREVFMFINRDNQTTIRKYLLNEDQHEDACQKFLKIVPYYYEVYSRDHDALVQENFNVKLRAIVLLEDGYYRGHIYAWQSPTNPAYLFAMGIRNKIDNVFCKYSNIDSYVENASHFLLEGVRRLGLKFDAKYIVVVSPISIMKNILTNLGFQRVSLSGQIIGNSINSSLATNINCYQLEDIKEPLINKKKALQYR